MENDIKPGKINTLVGLKLPCAIPRIVVTHYDLSKKPIIFWCNMKDGFFHKGIFNKVCSEIKRLVGYKYANSIVRMEAYGCAFTLGITMLDDKSTVEVRVQCSVSEKVVYQLIRKTIRGEKFSWKELCDIDSAIKDEGYRIWTLSKPNDQK